MNNLCIRDLAEQAGGRLRLGSLPPLSGDMEPFGRIVTDSRHVNQDDVFWGLSDEASRFAEEAFLRGASGVVVSGRTIEPWAGCFAIEVDDGRRALWELAVCTRENFLGNVIAVADSNGQSKARQRITSVLDQKFNLETFDPIESDDSLALTLVNLQESQDFCILPLRPFGANGISSFLDATRPDIVVIIDRGLDERSPVESTKDSLAALSEQNLVLVSGDNPELRDTFKATNAKVLWLRRAAHCDLHVDAIVGDNNQTLVTV